MLDLGGACVVVDCDRGRCGGQIAVLFKGPGGVVVDCDRGRCGGQIAVLSKGFVVLSKRVPRALLFFPMACSRDLGTCFSRQ